MPGEKKTTKPERKTLIRGADGTLYAMTDEQLKKFAVSDQQQKAVDKILADADADFVAGRLSTDVITKIQQAQGCVQTIAFGDPEPEISTNRRI